MVYAALNTLLILGDDLSRVDRAAIVRGLRQYQAADGRWAKSPDNSGEACWSAVHQQLLVSLPGS